MEVLPIYFRMPCILTLQNLGLFQRKYPAPFFNLTDLSHRLSRFCYTKKQQVTCHCSQSTSSILWVVVSNIFYFHPYLGNIPILTNIFQKGLKPPTSTPFFQVILLLFIIPMLYRYFSALLLMLDGLHVAQSMSEVSSMLYQLHGK